MNDKPQLKIFEEQLAAHRLRLRAAAHRMAGYVAAGASAASGAAVMLLKYADVSTWLQITIIATAAAAGLGYAMAAPHFADEGEDE